MKKAICFLFVLCLVPIKSFAGQTGKLGVGLAIGEPFGPTVKYWINEKQAVNLGIGLEDDGIFYGDYLWHGWQSPTQPAAGKVGFYTGIGLRFENEEHGEDKSGFRVPLGINLLFNRSPIELFGEIVPVMQFSPESDLTLDGAIGGRVYFGH